VKKVYLPLSILCLIVTFFLFSSVKADGSARIASVNNTIVDSVVIEKEAASVEAAASMLYESMGLDKLGLSKQAMQYAYKGHRQLVEKGLVQNSNVLTICDFSQSSSKKRMYILDLKNEKVLLNTYVAHGKNSGLNYAEKFSNTPESLQSSLGFYVTKATYSGKHGLSLRLAGLERGFNDRAEARAVVVHGAAYIGDGRAGAPYMGRSFGCPAVPQEHAPKVINLIKGGTALFIYSPNQSYIKSSKILNS
jgi:hypothetical protein